jgi:hypothetical protein
VIYHISEEIDVSTTLWLVNEDTLEEVATTKDCIVLQLRHYGLYA